MIIKILIYLAVFAPIVGLCEENIVTFKSGADQLGVKLPSEVSLSQGLIRGGAGINDVSYQTFLTIKVFEEVAELKKFTERNQGKQIEIYLYGKKVASPINHSIISKGEMSVYLPNKKQFLLIKDLLREKLLEKEEKAKKGNVP